MKDSKQMEEYKEQTVDLSLMLAAREQRAYRQRELLSQYRLPLVSFSMNIAGPVKNGPMIRRAFALGRRLLMDQLSRNGAGLVYREEIDEITGCEGLYVIDQPPERLKAITCWIEEQAPLGRLYDLDVLMPAGDKLDRPEPRRCLICGRPAKECARSRTHTVEELQAATKALLKTSLDGHDARTAAGLAVRALLYEVCVTPKPGLVDRQDNGSHRDMDAYSFMASAAALTPYFETCVGLGRATADRPAAETLAAIRPHGREAEAAMLRATGGVNTHKGAIYSMGLLCAALGRLAWRDWQQPETVLSQIAQITAGTVERELGGAAKDVPLTAGQRIYRQYGIAGVRGEAEAGFPSVLKYGLPVLEKGLAQGKSRDEAGAAALLALLAHTPDTNMIARGGLERQRQTAREAAALLVESPYPDWEALKRMNEAFVRDNLSPGGSADLLALCWMLRFLKEEAEEWKA